MPIAASSYKSRTLQEPWNGYELTGSLLSACTPPLLHLQPAYADMGFGPGSFPVAESLAHSLLCLPIYPELADAEVDFVGTQLISYLGSVDT